MDTMRSFLFRLAGFAGAPILSALAPFIILPVVSRLVGQDGWANFSAGQAIGILGMVGVLFGWSVVGPVRVARATSAHERAVILRESMGSRGLTAVVAVPAAAIVTYLICTPDYRLEAVLVAIAMTLGGFSPAWFCIGEGNPRALMLFDAAPKLVASAVALPIILVTGQVIWYPLLLVLTTLPCFAAHAIRVGRGHDPAGEPARRPLAVLATLTSTAGIDAAANAYSATPIPIATAGLSSEEASAFASADRIYRIGMLAVIAVGNAFQAWVLDPSAPDRGRRHLLAFGSLAGVGLLGGIAIATFGPWATALLFGPAVAADPVTCLLFGVAFFFISSSTPLIRNLLIPAGRYRLVFGATVASALVGLGTMLAGALSDSAAIIATGVAAAEGVVLLALLAPAIRAYRADTRPENPATLI